MDRPTADLFAELQWRGLVNNHTPGAGQLLDREPVVVYHGIDATADSLHIGNLVGACTLRRLQRAGHRPVGLLGGGTSLIGDPSGKESERPLLSADQIDANATAIRRQLERLLDFETGPAPAVLLDNGAWLRSLRLTEFLRDVGKHFPVNVMLAKESVRSRLQEREQGISYTEFSYMLLQAYDYLHLFDEWGCRLQVGGSDQWGNVTAGIDLIRRTRAAEVHGFTWPLVTKADGTKFGKSESGNVWLDPERTSPYQFFQFWVRVDDADVGAYLRLLTDLERPRIEELEAEVAAHPEGRAAQQALALELTTLVHGRQAAESAQLASRALFGGEVTALEEATLLDVFADAPSSTRPWADLDPPGASVVDLLADAGLVSSRGSARKAIEQGGVYVNNRRESDVERRLSRQDLLADRYVLLRRGKRDYHLLRFG